MNDGIYEISNGMEMMETTDDVNVKKKKKYNTKYPTAEYFEVYSPLISTRYGQVFWAQMDPVALPTEIITRFQNKTMAIVGYEVDQVRRIPITVDNEDTSDDDDDQQQQQQQWQDISVPITHAYNHHYIASIHNQDMGQMQSVSMSASADKATLPYHHAMMTHGTEEIWDFVPHHHHHHSTTTTSSSSTTTSGGSMQSNAYHNEDGILHAQIFSEGNGGEMRLSYHGYVCLIFVVVLSSLPCFCSCVCLCFCCLREMTTTTSAGGSLFTALFF